MVNAWFDGHLSIRRGDNVKIERGFVGNDGGIRATIIENLSSGNRQVSRINGTMMTTNPQDFDPPIVGRVENFEIRNSNTYFTLREGVYTEEHIFIEAGNPIRGRDILANIFSNELSSYVKICDPYIDENTIKLLQNVPDGIPAQIICHTIHNQSATQAEIERLNASGKSIGVRRVDRSAIHARYIITENYGWIVDHSLKDLGTRDANIRALTSTDDLPSLNRTFVSRWNDGTDFP